LPENVTSLVCVRDWLKAWNDCWWTACWYKR